ncbi:BA14K family protein [Roseibium sp. M-1]
MSDKTRKAAGLNRGSSFLRGCLLAAAVAVSAALAGAGTASPAHADGIYFGGGGIGFGFGTGGYRGGVFFGGPLGFYGPPYRPYGAPYYYHPYDSRAYPYRSRVYVNPPRYRNYGQPQRVPYTKTGLAPFTPQYMAYCSRKFRSFNPNTGMYLARSGIYRFCR